MSTAYIRVKQLITGNTNYLRVAHRLSLVFREEYCVTLTAFEDIGEESNSTSRELSPMSKVDPSTLS
jgi:hypothetical protein